MRPLLAGFSPDPDLAPYVDSVWVHEVVPLPGTVRALPTAAPRLCIHYGEGTVTADSAIVPGSVITGLQTLSREFGGSGGRVCSVVVRFTPWGAAQLLRENMAAFSDTMVGMSDVLGSAVSSLEALLHELQGDPAAVSRVVQAYLRQRLPPTAGEQLVRSAVVHVLRSQGRLTVSALTRALGVSERRLERAFRAVVGAPPKRFSRIVRFQAALARLRAGAAPAAVAADMGYADQAHLTREIGALSGLSPGQLSLRQPSPLLTAETDAEPVSDFFNTTYL